MVFRQRPDGVYLGDVPALRRIVPYLMRTRGEAAVYYPQRIEVEHLLAWLDEVNQGRSAGERTTLFHVLLTAISRTLRLRPETNRFIAGRRTYRHHDISISFIVKKAMDDQAPETQLRLVFTGDETVEQVRDRVSAALARERGAERGRDDQLVDLLASWPRPVLNQVSRLVGVLDDHNVLPRALMEAIPLYTSVYVVNAGSIGIDPPFHHLYEYGSASVFVAIGKVGKKPVVDEHGDVVARDCLDLVYTVDERASDGYYFARTAEVLRRLVTEPQLLERPGITVAEILAGWPHGA
jgi:hypothetical protein